MMQFSFLKKTFTILIFSFSMLFLNACAPRLGGEDYEVSSVGEISTTLKGIIKATRTVMLRPNNSANKTSGALVGTVGGAVLGSNVGGGSKMPLVSAVIGGIAGGVAGHAIEEKITEQKGTEYQIELDNGKLITLVQGITPTLSVGQRVLVIKSNLGRSRVIADNISN